MDIFDKGFGDSPNYKREDHFDAEVVEKVSECYRDILIGIGENTEREGLIKTPERAAKAMAFLTQGYSVDPKEILRSAKFNEKYNQMIIVKDIEFYSLCEHHMLPFYGKAHVAYIPNGTITGLSKIARVVEAYARRLQVQERLTVQIHNCIKQVLEPQGVAVVLEANHLCMQMRGVESQNSRTTTAEYSGAFMTTHKTREEFLSLIKK